MTDIHASNELRRRDFNGSTALTPAKSVPFSASESADEKSFGIRVSRLLRELALRIERADPSERLGAFKAVADVLAREVLNGWIDRQSAVDRAHHWATEYGIIAQHGTDVVQAQLAGAFRPSPSITAEPVLHVAEGRGLIVRRASDIVIEPIEWAWPSRIAIGKQTLIVGEPGLGKSQLTTFLAAAVTTGGPWPCGEGRAPLGSVIILSAEDDAADTILPRLIAAGAVVSRVLIVSAVRTDDGKARRSFNLQADLDLLEKEIAKAGDVRLVIIDPISSFMGKSDSHKNADVRGVLEPVGEMAARLRVAVVFVTHKSKGKGNNAINAAIGSIGFTGVVRAAFMVEKDPDDAERRLFLQIKNNIAKDAGGLAFRIGQHLIEGDILASAIYWDSERVSCTADEVLAANENGSDKPARTEAEDFLRDILRDGQRPAKDIEGEAKEAGISWRTVNRAKKALGVVAERKAESGDGFGRSGRWHWSLPDTAKDAKNSYECQPQDVAALGEIGILSEREAG
ncbi:MAG: AAA family ATPase [Alphaproteobacteria bacterium]|nr:AAA family ATPase [Alphaproteobacteria bacterium]